MSKPIDPDDVVRLKAYVYLRRAVNIVTQEPFPSSSDWDRLRCAMGLVYAVRALDKERRRLEKEARDG